MSDKKDRCRQLMMADLDGELSPFERNELQDLLNSFPDLIREIDSFRQLKEVTNPMTLKKADPEIWETYWYNIYNRIERSIAWFIFALGAGILIVYGIGEAMSGIWRDPDISVIIKIGLFGALLGVVLLLISVLREKLFVRRNERYKEVQR